MQDNRPVRRIVTKLPGLTPYRQAHLMLKFSTPEEREGALRRLIETAPVMVISALSDESEAWVWK